MNVYLQKKEFVLGAEHSSMTRHDQKSSRAWEFGKALSQVMMLMLTLEGRMRVARRSWYGRFFQGKVYKQRSWIGVNDSHRWRPDEAASSTLKPLSHGSFLKRDDWGQLKKHLKCAWPHWVLHLANQYSQTFSQLRWEDQRISKHKLICIELKNKSPNIRLFQTSGDKVSEIQPETRSHSTDKPGITPRPWEVFLLREIRQTPNCAEK